MNIDYSCGRHVVSVHHGTNKYTLTYRLDVNSFQWLDNSFILVLLLVSSQIHPFILQKKTAHLWVWKFFLLELKGVIAIQDNQTTTSHTLMPNVALPVLVVVLLQKFSSDLFSKSKRRLDCTFVGIH